MSYEWGSGADREGLPKSLRDAPPVRAAFDAARQEAPVSVSQNRTDGGSEMVRKERPQAVLKPPDSYRQDRKTFAERWRLEHARARRRMANVSVRTDPWDRPAPGIKRGRGLEL